MSRDEELQDRLRRLASAGPQEASTSVEQELRARFRARRKQKPMWSYMAEVAAVLLAAGGLFLALTHSRSTDRSNAIASSVNHASGFIALPYAQSGVPVEQAVIVRVKISVSELGVMGLPLAAAPRAREVSADLLVGQDGVARAVRLVE
jgi:hypothetical protein